MAARNEAMTAAERQAARRARLAADGGTVTTVALSKEALRALQRLTRNGDTNADAINAALIAAAKTKR